MHRSEDAANYDRDDEGLDLLLHTGPSRDERETVMGQLRVISAEGLIGSSCTRWSTILPACETARVAGRFCKNGVRFTYSRLN